MDVAFVTQIAGDMLQKLFAEDVSIGSSEKK